MGRTIRRRKHITIPQLRKSFEHIEEFVDKKLHQESNKVIAKQLQKEWQRVFHKKITQYVAESFVNQRCQIKPRVTRQTKRKKGGHLSMNGAPLDSSLRPGIYLENSVPVSTSDGQPYGGYLDYVQNGFWIPHIGQELDPIQGQSAWPVTPQSSFGSVSMKGGKKKGGSVGSFLDQAFSRPITSDSPSSIPQDLQRMWYGMESGPSPDLTQNSPHYTLGAHSYRPISF